MTLIWVGYFNFKTLTFTIIFRILNIIILVSSIKIISISLAPRVPISNFWYKLYE